MGEDSVIGCAFGEIRAVKQKDVRMLSGKFKIYFYYIAIMIVGVAVHAASADANERINLAPKKSNVTLRGGGNSMLSDMQVGVKHSRAPASAIEVHPLGQTREPFLNQNTGAAVKAAPSLFRDDD